MQNDNFNIHDTFSGQIIGYIRVSSADQNPARQLENAKLHKTFVDYASAKDSNRQQLKEMMAYVREGDRVVVHSLDRLARNIKDLHNIIETLNQKGVAIQFIQENLTFVPNVSNPMSMLLLNVIGAVAEFERSIIKERQREGIAVAKAKGVYKRNKRKITNDTFQNALEKFNNKISVIALAKYLGVTRNTVYSYLRENNLSMEKIIKLKNVDNHN